MDGMFPSIHPYEFNEPKNQGKRLYLLSHAKYTHLATCKDYQSALMIEQQYKNDPSLHLERKDLMESEISRFFPGFRDRFAYEGYFVATKTKILNKSQNRNALAWQQKSN